MLEVQAPLRITRSFQFFLNEQKKLVEFHCYYREFTVKCKKRKKKKKEFLAMKEEEDQLPQNNEEIETSLNHERKKKNETHEHKLAASKEALKNWQLSSYHGIYCQCLSCKLDHLKSSNPTTTDLLRSSFFKNWIPTEYRSMIVGALFGSFLTFCGLGILKQLNSTAYAHLFSKTPTVKQISQAPLILVNNATETISNIITSEPSLGIFHCPDSGIYQVSLQLNLMYRSSLSTTTTGSRQTNVSSQDFKEMNVFIVKNGLPNDDAARLRLTEIRLESDVPQMTSFYFKTFLRSEDYLQVFGELKDDITIPLAILGFDYGIQSVKNQK
jgi:hypothetical protein